MDFDQFIKAHIAWKNRLSQYLAKPDHSLTPMEIAQDNKCDVGKWIAGEGAKYSSLPEFQTLRTEHARFHRAAADVIRHADSGQNVNEEVALGGKSEFSAASSAIVSAIMAMKNKVAVPVGAHK